MNMKNIPLYVVASGKGGVGKSTIAYYLADICSKNNLKVGLIDADICGPSLHLLLKNLNDASPHVINEKIIPANIDNIRFISSAFYAPGGAFVRAPRATGMLKGFFEDVHWDDCDLIIVDLPPGTGDIQLSLIQEVKVDGVICVTTPDTLSVEDVAKSMTQFRQGGVPILGIIENFSCLEIMDQTFYPFGKGGADELSALFEVPILARISQYLSKEQENTLFFSSLEKVVNKLFYSGCGR
jgi:ATP-binding protein involved in chromosome partitioning